TPVACACPAAAAACVPSPPTPPPDRPLPGAAAFGAAGHNNSAGSSSAADRANSPSLPLLPDFALRLGGPLPTGLFFRRLHVFNARSLTGHARIRPLQRQIDVRIGQRPFQMTHPILEPLQLVDLFRLFHTNHHSA